MFCHKLCLAAAALVLSCASVPVERGALGRPFHLETLGETVWADNAAASIPWQPVAEGIAGVFLRVAAPRIEAWALRVDFAVGGIDAVMNRPGLTAGSIPSLRTSTFLQEYDCLAALNANPFAPVSFREGERRVLTGVFVSEGTLVSAPDSRYGALVFLRNGSGAVVRQNAGYDWTGSAVRYAVGGFALLLENGAVVASAERAARHPRSAAGFSHGGTRLYFLAIDGRRAGSIGATERETALIMKLLGAENALNLDGGGSTALVLRKNGRPVRLNRGQFFGERAVAACIGVRKPHSFF